MVQLLLVGFLILLYFMYGRKKTGTSAPSDDELAKRNSEWVAFIYDYKKLAKTKDQKELLDSMLAQLSAQGLSIPTEEEAARQLTDLSSVTATQAADVVNDPSTVISAEERQETQDSHGQKSQIQLDNASILLYLGAFLFVASAGLFVVFGGIAGEVRTFAVMLVAFIMYGGGVWLYRNNTKLQQAGLAFAGIGIAIAPLIGLAAYNYIFDRSNGSAVWLVTSALCLLMYAHALFSLRKPLINYLFILTFLSLFESGVSIINAPIYYFGWVLAAIGIILTAASRYKGFWPELQESTRLSAAVFLPISIFVSVLMVPSHGAGQLGVSLLLAAAFYALEMQKTKGETQQINAVVAQASFILGTSSIIFSIDKSWPAVSIGLVLLCIVQTIIVLRTKTTVFWENFATVTIITALLAIFAGIQKPSYMLGSCLVLALVSAAVWIRQQRIDAYVIAALAIIALPVLFGQFFQTPRVGYSQQALLLLFALFIQFLVLLIRQAKFTRDELLPVQLTYIASSFVVVASSFWARPSLSVALSTLVALSMVLLAKRQKDNDWAIAAGIFVSAPILWTWSESNVFLVAVLISLSLNIMLSLAYRKELNRWFSTIVWLLLPLALGDVHVFIHWNSGAYAWAYLFAMLGLIVSRAIARGVVLASDKIPLASYARSASLSYVTGYCLAATLAISLSISQGNNIQTTVILSVTALAVWLLSEYVEKQPNILMLLPLFLQAILLSAIHPSFGTDRVYVFTFASTVLAVMTYFSVPDSGHNNPRRDALCSGALLAIFITPFTVIFAQQTIWTMPIGLLVASLLVFYHIRSTAQEYRELAGGLIVLALYWIMYFAGVRNIQAYTHVLAALFAVYAYWRNSRGEIKESDNYLMVMLATATIPLGLQALSGVSGGLYGWWLIIEQVGFILLGMAFGKRFITMWGIYVAVAAVLYQLRGLGWAALAILAVFLIGLGIFKIQKYTDKR